MWSGYNTSVRNKTIAMSYCKFEIGLRVDLNNEYLFWKSRREFFLILTE